MNRRSIRFRLTVWYAAILAATLAIVGVGVWLAIRGSIYETVDRDLHLRLRTLRDYLQRQGSEESVEDLVENAAIAPATRFRVSDNAGHWLYASPGTEGWGTPPDPSHLPQRGRIETVGTSRRPVRVLSARLSSGVVQIGIPIDEFQEMLTAFTWTALLASPILMILASVGGYWMSRRALAPVEEIARTASDIEAQNLSERLPLRGTDDEFDQLSATLNAMLARLEDSFRHITQFTADASHELRTPIAIIRTTAEVIRRKPRSEREYAEALDRILAESERTSELIEDLMLLARADANTEEMDFEPIVLPELVQTVCADARTLAETAGISLRTNGLIPCTVSGERSSLRRLLLILLDNAIKYSKPGGEVYVGLNLCQRQEGQRAMLEVRDNGIGIAPADLPHIFERFYRASKDRSRMVDGVGLGLSIAQSIAHRHGGEIEVESRSGAGSTARFVVPIA